MKRENIKSLLVMVLILAGGSSLTACGKSADSTTASPGSTQLFPNINP